MYAWDIELGKSLMRSESIVALLSPADCAKNNPVNISKLNFSESGQMVGFASQMELNLVNAASRTLSHKMIENYLL